MRSLIVIGLSVCTATAATAQTELIIRRPDRTDQVIQLADSARTARIEIQLDSILGARNVAEAGRLMAARLKDLQRDMAQVRLDTLQPITTLALRLPQVELATRNELQGLKSRLQASWRAQPHFGIAVDYRPRDTDRWGAYVMAVTPGSPAAQAGILSGDIITRIAGKSLVEKDRKDASATDASLPYVRLTTIIAQLDIGKSVAVELRRGNQMHTVHVTPDESDMTQPAIAQGEPFTKLFAAPRGNVVSTISVPALAPDMQSFSVFEGDGFGDAYGPARLFGNIELAPMNDKLGAYFGTTEGVLVINNVADRRSWVAYDGPRTSVVARGDVRVLADSIQMNFKTPELDLLPGDVITAVDGRKVTTPSQLMRIVASYDRGEEFKLQVVRQKHAETIPVKMP